MHSPPVLDLLDQVGRKRVNCAGVKSYHSALVAAAVAVALMTGCGGAETNMTADQALQAALSDVSGLRFDSAYRHFDLALKKSLPGSEIYLQALYGKACGAHHRMPADAATIAEAAVLYHRVVQEFPQSIFAARAMMALGRVAELQDYSNDTPDVAAAREWYQKVINRWPDDPVAGEATLKLAASHIQTFQEPEVRKGIALLEDFLTRKPNDPLNSACAQYLGDSYFIPLSKIVKDDQQREAAYRKSLEFYMKADAIGWMQKGRQGAIYWRMATIAERYLHDAPLAAKCYSKIILEAPNCGKGYESQLGIRRLNQANPGLNAPVPEIDVFRNSRKVEQSVLNSEQPRG